ncbi:GspH/FimT family pseudopilin [Lysobacter sp. CW239]|uniref:GspH/FimT family pseudopilin n=1 Tax=Lysobacter sp. CW239 TaxID=2762611 RepID=UPI001747CA2E|nr:GspH/FimT family pseudopilin [Lysobacter sp. CW239]QOD90414.1 GspH/FimT family pseudopilin [Lysobacter sp. CW239]
MQLARSPAAPVKHLQIASRARGFTLVELMVTVAVAAILMAIATPSFTSIINSNRLTSAANEMVATLQFARMEAVRQNRTVRVCSSGNGTSCGGGGAWLVLDAAGAVLRVNQVNPKVVSSATVGSFIFRADGLARETAASGLLNNDLRFCIDTTTPKQNIRLVSIGSGSRVSTSTPKDGGACK